MHADVFQSQTNIHILLKTQLNLAILVMGNMEEIHNIPLKEEHNILWFTNLRWYENYEIWKNVIRNFLSFLPSVVIKYTYVSTIPGCCYTPWTGKTRETTPHSPNMHICMYTHVRKLRKIQYIKWQIILENVKLRRAKTNLYFPRIFPWIYNNLVYITLRCCEKKVYSLWEEESQLGKI